METIAFFLTKGTYKAMQISGYDLLVATIRITFLEVCPGWEVRYSSLLINIQLQPMSRLLILMLRITPAASFRKGNEPNDL